MNLRFRFRGVLFQKRKKSLPKDTSTFIYLSEVKPKGPHEGEHWDLDKEADIQELEELVDFEQPTADDEQSFADACWVRVARFGVGGRAVGHHGPLPGRQPNGHD